MPLADLVQILHICRKTGHLSLIQEGERAGVFFVEGELRHAWLRDRAGEDAFHSLMTWTRAVISFESGARTERSTVTQPTLGLLMDAMRRLDEGRRSPGGP